MDEDQMFQEAAQTLLGGTTEGNNATGAAAGAEGGTPAAPVIEASGEAAPVGEANQSQQNTDAAATAAATAAAAAPAVPEPINFEGISNGLVKGPEDVTRISNEYRQMTAELNDLREKVKKDPFANEFVRTLNQMQADGKSPAQVRAFIQLQDLGDISKLPVMEAMVQAKVLRDGRDADIAKAQLERKYGITPDMDDLDRRIAEANMADDAKADYDYLLAHKKELASPRVDVNAPAAAVLSREEILSKVAPIKDKVKEQFTTLGTINLNGKVDKDGKPTADAIMFDLPVPQAFKDTIPGRIENFFVEQGLELNEANLKTAIGVVNYELFNEYGVKLIQDAVNAFSGPFEKKIRSEYENNNPPKKITVHQSFNNNQLDDAFLRDYAMGN